MSPSIRRTCACTSAGRRSTTSPISATPGRSSSSTCCSACSGTSTATEHVTYVRNITDVDDKINARAAEEYPDLPLNEAIRKVTETTAKQFHEDVAALGCLPPTVEPRATEYINRPDQPEDMIRLIERLVENGHAYVAEGHVLFHVASMPDYGKLSRRTLDEMIAGARVEVAPYKRDPMDFVLWKPSKPGEPALAVAVGQWGGPAGTSSARRWPARCSARPSTSTAAASTSSSRTTRTRSPSRAARTARR